jgi:hypothetical protein
MMDFRSYHYLPGQTVTLSPHSDDLVGQPLVVSHRCALEDRANKKQEEKILGQC